VLWVVFYELDVACESAVSKEMSRQDADEVL
jgi:hypothetical protein